MRGRGRAKKSCRLEALTGPDPDDATPSVHISTSEKERAEEALHLMAIEEPPSSIRTKPRRVTRGINYEEDSSSEGEEMAGSSSPMLPSQSGSMTDLDQVSNSENVVAKHESGTLTTTALEVKTDTPASPSAHGSVSDPADNRDSEDEGVGGLTPPPNSPEPSISGDTVASLRHELISLSKQHDFEKNCLTEAKRTLEIRRQERGHIARDIEVLKKQIERLQREEEEYRKIKTEMEHKNILTLEDMKSEREVTATRAGNFVKYYEEKAKLLSDFVEINKALDKKNRDAEEQMNSTQVAIETHSKNRDELVQQSHDMGRLIESEREKLHSKQEQLRIVKEECQDREAELRDKNSQLQKLSTQAKALDDSLAVHTTIIAHSEKEIESMKKALENNGIIKHNLADTNRKILSSIETEVSNLSYSVGGGYYLRKLTEIMTKIVGDNNEANRALNEMSGHRLTLEGQHTHWPPVLHCNYHRGRAHPPCPNQDCRPPSRVALKRMHAISTPPEIRQDFINGVTTPTRADSQNPFIDLRPLINKRKRFDEQPSPQANEQDKQQPVSATSANAAINLRPTINAGIWNNVRNPNVMGAGIGLIRPSTSGIFNPFKRPFPANISFPRFMTPKKPFTKTSSPLAVALRKPMTKQKSPKVTSETPEGGISVQVATNAVIESEAATPPSSASKESSTRATTPSQRKELPPKKRPLTGER